MRDSAAPPTATLAKIYADQGYWRLAAETYRELVNRHPQRAELRLALADAEQRLSLRRTTNWKEILMLLRQWAVLLKQNRRREADRSGNIAIG